MEGVLDTEKLDPLVDELQEGDALQTWYEIEDADKARDVIFPAVVSVARRWSGSHKYLIGDFLFQGFQIWYPSEAAAAVTHTGPLTWRERSDLLSSYFDSYSSSNCHCGR
jgi:hypothetical protein